MNNPNPFVPKGSLLEQQTQRRSHLKIAVSCVLAVSIAGLVVMLIQGCKREQPPADTSMPGLDTNAPDMTATNSPVVDTNAPMIPPPMTNPPAALVPPAPVIPPPVVETPGTDYVVVKGDTLGKIAHAHHVTLKDLEAANPGVDSKHLKVNQKLTIPASSGSMGSSVAPASATGSVDAGGDTYVVKSGDTLTTIAKHHGTTVKALMAANNLSTTKIKVKQVLKLPASSAAVPAPAVDTTPAPAPAPMTLPAPAPAPSPAK